MSIFRSIKPTQRETDRFRWRGADRVYPCPIFKLSVNTVPCFFAKSLAIEVPGSRTVAYPSRSDSVRVYWTCTGGGSPWSTVFVRNPDFILIGNEREISRLTFRSRYANQFVERYEKADNRVHSVCFVPQWLQIKPSDRPFAFAENISITGEC